MGRRGCVQFSQFETQLGHVKMHASDVCMKPFLTFLTFLITYNMQAQTTASYNSLYHQVCAARVDSSDPNIGKVVSQWALVRIICLHANAGITMYVLHGSVCGSVCVMTLSITYYQFNTYLLHFVLMAPWCIFVHFHMQNFSVNWESLLRERYVETLCTKALLSS